MLNVSVSYSQLQPGDEIVSFPDTVAPRLVRTTLSDEDLNRSVLVSDVSLHWPSLKERGRQLVMKGKAAALDTGMMSLLAHYADERHGGHAKQTY